MQQLFKRLRGRLVAMHWHYKMVDLTLNCHSSFVHGPWAALQTFRDHAGIVLTAIVPYIASAPPPREFSCYTVRVIWSVYKCVVCLCETTIDCLGLVDDSPTLFLYPPVCLSFQIYVAGSTNRLRDSLKE